MVVLRMDRSVLGLVCSKMGWFNFIDSDQLVTSLTSILTPAGEGYANMKIAFIGLGNMGGGMAANLVKAGHEVRAFDLAQAALG